MSRGLTSKKDCLSVLRLRLLSELGSLDYWTGSFELGDEVIGLLLEARIALQEAVLLVARAEETMQNEE